MHKVISAKTKKPYRQLSEAQSIACRRNYVIYQLSGIRGRLGFAAAAALEVNSSYAIDLTASIKSALISLEKELMLEYDKKLEKVKRKQRLLKALSMVDDKQ